MTVISDLQHIEDILKNPVLTIGNFDGVHKGHLALFEKVKEKAKAIKGTSSVMTFDPHPTRIMKPGNGPQLLTPTQQKLKLMEKAGIDVIFCIPFTKQFASISARDFVKKILVEKIGIKEIVVGYDYSFGSGREGNIELLKQLGKDFGFAVNVVKPIHVNHTLVSSTSIRELVQEGNLSEAERLLGRRYQICGIVVKGKNRGGRLLGFPTANLKLIDELTPKPGVYAVEVLIGDQIYKGLTNIGYNPTFHNNQFSVETHILDFSENLLGKTVQIDFIERLRDEKTFESIEELGEQISKDITRARKIFESSPISA